jgi:hypothetical protein
MNAPMNARDKELAVQAGLEFANDSPEALTTAFIQAWGGDLAKYSALIRADEREAIIDEWWSIVQGDLENGVKCLNEQAAIKWRKEYPSMATFGEWLEARGNT